MAAKINIERLVIMRYLLSLCADKTVTKQSDRQTHNFLSPAIWPYA